MTANKTSTDTLVAGAKTELNTSLNTTKNELSAAIAGTKTELSDSLNNTKNELNTAITGTRTDLTNDLNSTKDELNTSLGNTKTELNTSIVNVKNMLVSADDEIKDELTRFKGEFSDYKLSMQETVTGINDRIDTLEAAFNLNNHDTMQLINTIFMKLDSLDTTNIKGSVEKYYNEVTRKLASLKNSLINIQNNINTSTAEGQALNEEIAVLYQDIINVQASVDDYLTNMNGRIDGLNTKIDNAKTAITTDDENLEQILADVNSALQQTISAANAYTGSINAQVDELFGKVKDLSKLVSEPALIDKINNVADGLSSSQDAITKQVSELEKEVNELKEQLKGAKADYNNKVDNLSERTEVTVINGTTINPNDWTFDNATNKYYIEISNPAIIDDSHIDVQYEYSPAAKPGYSADPSRNTMRITVDKQISMSISKIFIYSKYNAASNN
jgi:chromosome segregation ATPase